MFRLVFAYLDPAIGATVIQLVLAGFVGIGAVVKLRWKSIKKAFGRGDQQVVIPEELTDTPQ